MKTTIQILLVLLIAAACRKPGNQNVVTIEGQLMAGVVFRHNTAKALLVKHIDA